jgi:hypothetical protein
MGDGYAVARSIGIWHLACGSSFDGMRQMGWSTSSCLVPDLHQRMLRGVLAPAGPPNGMNESCHIAVVFYYGNIVLNKTVNTHSGDATIEKNFYYGFSVFS